MKKLGVLFIFILFLGGVCAVCEDGQIDINTASATELDEIVHIGEERAKEIIKLRAEQLFTSVDDLVRVSGIAAGGSRLSDIIQEGLACVNGEQIEEIPETNEETEENNETPDIIEDNDVQDNQAETSSYSYQAPIQSEVIKLNTKSIKSKNNTEDKDKSVYAKYGFTIFCVLLGTLLILKKKKHKKNEFGR